MAAGNPLYDIHNAFWDMLEDKSYFTDLVKAGNRRKLTTAKWDFFQEHAQPADYPEVTIVQTGVEAGDRALGCNGTALRLIYEVWIATGEQPADSFWDVQWAVFRAFMDWEDHVGALTWDDPEGKVWNCDLLNSEDSLLNKRLNREVKGWSCAWRGAVDCDFTHSTLNS